MPRSVSWSVIAVVAFGTVLYMWTLWTSNPHLHWIDAIRYSVKHGGAFALGGTLLYCLGMHLIWWREKRHEPYLTDSIIQSIASGQ
jgi:hypothetical protein